MDSTVCFLGHPLGGLGGVSRVSQPPNPPRGCPRAANPASKSHTQYNNKQQYTTCFVVLCWHACNMSHTHTYWYVGTRTGGSWSGITSAQRGTPGPGTWEHWSGAHELVDPGQPGPPWQAHPGKTLAGGLIPIRWKKSCRPHQTPSQTPFPDPFSGPLPRRLPRPLFQTPSQTPFPGHFPDPFQTPSQVPGKDVEHTTLFNSYRRGLPAPTVAARPG